MLKRASTATVFLCNLPEDNQEVSIATDVVIKIYCVIIIIKA